MVQRHFPADFLWGASTASYQIEGAVHEEGRKDSIWDVFCRRPGAIRDGSSGEIADDHYHRYPEDIQIMKDLGLKAYRFSLSWPRIFPDGFGTPNEKGLDFYDRVIDETLRQGIDPWICLYHWDLPQALHRRGGWTNRDIASWFGELAEISGKRYGDRVKVWSIINEHSVTASLGYEIGEHAPGIKDFYSAIAVMHHQNLAQGRAIDILRSLHPDSKVGTIFALSTQTPYFADCPEHQALASKAEDIMFGQYCDPLYFGKYNAHLLPYVSEFIQDGDMDIIRKEIDFFGLNYYMRYFIQKTNFPTPYGYTGTFIPYGAAKLTDMAWEIKGEGLYDMLHKIKARYNNPTIYITENGCAMPDHVQPDGRIEDNDRIDYLQEYLSWSHKAISEGVNLKGYLIWTLLDNFEWAYGLAKRFGLVHVDYTTLKRTPKKSWYWMQKLIADNEIEDNTL